MGTLQQRANHRVLSQVAQGASAKERESPERPGPQRQRLACGFEPSWYHACPPCLHFRRPPLPATPQRAWGESLLCGTQGGREDLPTAFSFFAGARDTDSLENERRESRAVGGKCLGVW